jgi:hypothetical protein
MGAERTLYTKIHAHCFYQMMLISPAISSHRFLKWFRSTTPMRLELIMPARNSDARLGIKPP